MKKKIALACLAVLMTLGLVAVGPTWAEDEQDFMQVSPRVWVLAEEGTTGTDLVTIHLAIPYLSVDTSTLIVSVIGEEYQEDECLITSVFADDRGDLVIKFLPGTEGLLGPYLVEVTGFYVDGGGSLSEEGEPLIRDIVVKEAGPMGTE